MARCKLIQVMNFWTCAILLGILIYHLPASAASFDCTKTITLREKLICQDPELSSLDAQLGSKYKERLNLLSPKGAKLFRNSERHWLHFVSIVCPDSQNFRKDSLHNLKDCLSEEYRDRLKQLDMVGQKIGPFVFNRIDIYAAKPAPDKDGSRSGFYYQHTAYPQIDNIENSMTKLWNKQMERSLRLDDCGIYGDYDTYYKMGYASDKLISMTSAEETYCHGAPHGFGGSQTINTILIPSPHRLNSSDVFGSGQDWKAKLQKLFMEDLQKQGWKPRSACDKENALEIFLDPNRWLFTDKGIEVDFGPYEVCAYACTPRPVTVSWDSIRPLLVQNFMHP